MAVSSRASLSADATTTALGFLLLAAIAALAWAPEARAEHRAWLFAAAVALCLTKLPYVPLLAMLLVVPRERLELRRRWRYWSALAVSALAAIAFSAWVAATFGGVLRPGAGVDREAQVRDALHEPLRFLHVLVGDYLRFGPRYVAQLVGAQLGWLDTKLPLLVVWAFLVAFLLLLLLAPHPVRDVRPWQRGWAIAVVALVAILISASQYAVWTRYRADVIEGVQGRYFLPLAPLVVLALHRRSRLERPPAWLPFVLGAGYVALATTVCWCVYHRFYV